MLGFDRYSAQARLLPAVLVAMPIGVAVAVAFPQEMFVWGAGSGLFVTTGIAMLMTERARREGKAVEVRVFKRLGARPTTIMLRHSDKRLDPVTTARYHAHLGSLVPGVSLPSAESESVDPVRADAAYDSCVNFMLERTRDAKDFPLVFKELVSYGFVRNLRGLKSGAIGSALIGTVLCFCLAVWTGPDAIRPTPAVGCIISAVLLATWLLKLNDQWVEDAGFDYAKRLLASCDLIAARNPA